MSRNIIIFTLCITALCFTGCANKNSDDALSGVERESSVSVSSSSDIQDNSENNIVTTTVSDVTDISDITSNTDVTTTVSDNKSSTGLSSSDKEYDSKNNSAVTDSQNNSENKVTVTSVTLNPSFVPKSDEQIEREAQAIKDYLSENNVYLPTNSDGSVYLGHEENSPDDKFENLHDGLHNDAVHDDENVRKFSFDNAEFEVNAFTPQDFIDKTSHEWHIYTDAGFKIKDLSPGETAFFHMDSNDFSDKANQKKDTFKKNGQVVLYVENTSDTVQSLYNCTVYKFYVNYAGYGVEYYDNIPIVEYYGLQILDKLDSPTDYFGDFRDSYNETIGEDIVARYCYGTIEKTAVNIDVISYQNNQVFIGFSIEK